MKFVLKIGSTTPDDHNRMMFMIASEKFKELVQMVHDLKMKDKGED